MSLKTLGKLLMGAGLTLLLYGVFMDTSVSSGYGRVVNLGLANDRLMYIMVGGFVFVGGVILFGVYKVKQTKEDEINEKVQSESRRAELKAQTIEKSSAISAKIGKDFIFKRLAHALGIAFLVSYISQPAIHTPTALVWFFYILMVALMLRPIDHSKAISQGWLLAALAMLLVILKMLMHGLFFRDHEYESQMDFQEALLTGIFLIPAAIFYFVSRRFALKGLIKREMD